MPVFPPHHRYSDFHDPLEAQALLDWTIANEARFAASTVSGGIVDEDRRRSARLFELGAHGDSFETRIRGRAPDLFARTGIAPFEIEHVELEIAAHGEGAHFAAHTDMPLGWGRTPLGGDSSGTQDRIVSAVYYYYREPKGFTDGALRLHRFGSNGGPGDFVDLEPLHNSLVVFPSWATHEVRTVHCPTNRFADFRFAINCWLCRKL